MIVRWHKSFLLFEVSDDVDECFLDPVSSDSELGVVNVARILWPIHEALDLPV